MCPPRSQINATLKDNILFGNAFDAERYAAAINAAQLRTDLMEVAA